MFRPFICTCDKRIGTVRKFVQSYVQVKHALLQPVVFYDGDDPEYMELLHRLEPVELIRQPTSDVQSNICFGLPTIMATKYKDEFVLFLEDDIIFSSQFVRAIGLLEVRMRQYPQVDIVTMYGNGGCYWPPKDNNFLYRFSGQEFYGNLCLAIRPKLINWWAANVDEVWEHPVWGWDIKIGQKFERNGFNWYCTKSHYVQHQVGPSAIDGVVKNVQSKLYRK